MSDYVSSAILIRRIEYGDYDYILTFFSLNYGKITVIAKNAKKSIKRFAGILELFSELNIVFTKSRGKDLFFLKEASLDNPFEGIRTDILKTAYASYWVEIINLWIEENVKHDQIFHLINRSLFNLDKNIINQEEISILFQLKYLEIAGLTPILDQCCKCNERVDNIKSTKIMFDLAKGGLVCEKCKTNVKNVIFLSKGTIKLLLWLRNNDINRVERIKFTRTSLEEGLKFMESFIPFQMGKEPRSLKFLINIR